LGKSKITKSGCEKYCCKATYWALVELLLQLLGGSKSKIKNAYRAADSCYFMSSSSQAITKYTKTSNMESIDMSAKDISTWQRKFSNLKV
jgi:hypothetical protein